jgi:hypothetical protein
MDYVGKYLSISDSFRMMADHGICIRFDTIPHAVIVNAYTHGFNAIEVAYDSRSPGKYDRRTAVRKAISKVVHLLEAEKP